MNNNDKGRWDPEVVAGMSLLGALVVLVFVGFGWQLWSAVNDRRDMSRCRDRGGNVEHLPPASDWRCVGVGATPERKP